MTDVIDTPEAEELNKRTRSPSMTSGGKEADLATSLRPGEDPEVIARQADGVEYVDTKDVGIGRLGLWDIKDDE